MRHEKHIESNVVPALKGSRGQVLDQEDGVRIKSQGAKDDPNCFQYGGGRVARTNRPDAEDADDEG